MAKRRPRLPEGGLIFSAEHGRMCPGCDQPVDACTCKDRPDVAPETKQRKGKGVTVITGIPLPPTELKTLAKQLKQRCSSGGTVKDGALEIQGDHRDAVIPELEKRGWTVKRVGG
jgi:translation initiation factor 1